VEAKTLLQVVDSKLNSTMFVLKLTTLLEFVVIGRKMLLGGMTHSKCSEGTVHTNKLPSTEH